MTQILSASALVLVVALLTVLACYNSLAHMKQQVRSAWAAMDAQLKQRYDVLVDLVTIIQAAGAADRTGIAAVVSAKHQAAVAFNPPQLAKAEGALSAAVRSVLGVADSEPELVRNDRYLEVCERLTAIESQIDLACAAYNDAVLEFDFAVHSFPNSITARAFGFVPQHAFTIANAAQSTPA